MKKSLILSLSALITLSACQKTESTAPQTQQDPHATHQVDSLATHEEPSSNAALELNNGEKWETNVEMLPFIQKQEQLLAEFDPGQKTYLELSQDLVAANDELIKSCTMTGKSHDVLHVWLTDHMNAMQTLEKSTEESAQQQAVATLKSSMQTYHEYFQ